MIDSYSLNAQMLECLNSVGSIAWTDVEMQQHNTFECCPSHYSGSRISACHCDVHCLSSFPVHDNVQKLTHKNHTKSVK